MLEKFYKLTNPQKSIWDVENFFEGTTINNICASVTIFDRINENALKKAVYNIVKKNDSFRTRILIKDNIPVQYFSAFEAFPIEVISIKNSSQFQEIQNHILNYKFNIIDSNLFYFKIVKFPDGHGILIFTVHHIIADSWSLGLFGQNIMQEYNYFAKNTIEPEMNYSYIDYINNENEYKQSPKYQNDKKYWEDLFQEVPEKVSFPATKKIDGSISHYSERKTFKIHNLKNIRQFCENHRVSIFNFFMSIYAIYLSRIARQDEIVIGTPILNRTNFKEKKTMGMFINTIPVKLNLSQDMSFTDLIHYSNLNIMNSLKHQRYSYSMLLEDLRKKDNSISTLYDVIVSYQITKAHNESLGNYTTEWYPNSYSANDCTIHITDLNDTGELFINYDYLTDKYDSIDIDDLNSRITYMIEQILDNEKILINNIEIITPQEKHQILHDFNNTFALYPRVKTIVDLFEEQVEKTPDNVAVVFENQQLTYNELNKKANSLGNYLISMGIEKKEVISFFFDKSIESIISILAILKCGCTYMPIDIDYPLERIQYMIDDSNSKLILTSNSLKNRLIGIPNTVCLNLKNIEIYNDNNIHITRDFDDLAYIMYTSGSTGQPKGVMVTNRNVVRLVKNTNYLKFEENDRILQTGSIVFDACTFEIWGALLNGLPVYLLKKSDLLNPAFFEKYILKNNITTLFLTTALFNKFCEYNSKMFCHLKYLLTGGEAVSIRHMNLAKKNNPNLNLVHVYGPTENTTFSTYYFVKNANNDTIPIGYPIANSTCYIVSKNMSLLPVGAYGELLVGGDGVSKGYLNKPERTKESFISSPFDNGILYRTGDLARWNKDGSIEFAGRIDNQVKIRGFRIELDEISLRIQNFKDIKECITIVKNIDNKKILCSYFSANSEIDVKSLKAFLEKSMPSYSIPSYFIQLEVLPININGKIDKKALPEPEYKSVSNIIVLPRNEIDTKLIHILKELFNIDNISIEDSFFELGGDSLSAITLGIKIQSEFHIKLLIGDILENPKIKAISDKIQKSTDVSKNISIPAAPKADFYSISSAEKRIYISSKMAGTESTLYNVPGGFIFDKKPDTDKLVECLHVLIRRHDVFRTYFEIENNTLVQKIREDVIFKIDSLENANFQDLEKIFRNFVKPFDLSKAPLIRAKLIGFSNKKFALLIDIHHIIFDGMSLNIFTDEFSKLYNNEALEPLKITYKDFAEFESTIKNSDEYKNAEKYWLNQFKDGVPILNMPTTYPRLSVQTFDGNNVYTQISSDSFKKIEQLSTLLNVTPYMILLSCYYILLFKYTSGEDIVIGTPIANRKPEDTYQMIGMFVNTIALRTTIDKELSFKEFLEVLRENVLNAYQYQMYPFDELINNLNIERDTSRNPLFDIMFIYQNNLFQAPHFNGIHAEYYLPNSNTSKFDLSLEVIPNNNCFDLIFEYSTKLFDNEFIENLSEHYLNIIDSVLNNIHTKIKNISIISEKEKNKILCEFNPLNVENTKQGNIVNLFEKQVLQHLDDTAVIFEGEKLTYKELNEKANSLCHYLKELHVKNTDIIAILEDRSLELIISILGVMKSGASYVLIDNTFPEDRINYIINDSSTKYCIIDNSTKNLVNTHTINIEEFEFSKYSNQNPQIDYDDNLCIIYTSGSTGNPKGVVLHKHGFFNLVFASDKEMGISHYRNILGIATVSFDMFAFELFHAILFGNTLILANGEEQKNPIAMSNLILKNNVDFLVITPSRIEFLLLEECNQPLKNVQCILLGGEKVSSNLFNRLQKQTSAAIFNGYGPTEITACCSMKKLTSSDITIGKPLLNSQIYICDSNLNLLPIGISGEICIGGSGVANGYLNNEKATLEHFVKNPFGEGLLYKSGDLGRFKSNGEIEYVDRLDNQIKLRGLRIELSEIESVILQYPNIIKAVVIKQTINTREFLSAYFVANKKIIINELRQYLAKHLPKYMIPSYFTPLDNFVYTPNGKIDRKMLPLPNEILNTSKEEYIAPKTQLQKKLVNIWEKVLNTRPIGVSDNFFELGGDSLLAMNLNMELQKIASNISYSDIFQYSTILKLEEKINSNETSLMFDKIENLPDNFEDVLQATTKKREKTKEFHPKNILLTGVTGFLGIHVLEQFIKNESCNVYCIIRNEPGITAKSKLQQKLHYYFNDEYNYLIDNRIFVIPGNLSEPGLGLKQDDFIDLVNSIDIVINCAANVSHFGTYEKFYNSNVKSVKNIIAFCRDFHKKLYHISTTGVSGKKLDLSYPKSKSTKIFKRKNTPISLTESKLYVGQIVDNVYARSKFEAETNILTAIHNGLDGYILRMGNLMPRYRDGVFQENILDNAFINKFISFIKIGIMPDYLYKQFIDFSPVDYAADAIYRLITHSNPQNRVFHLYNHKRVPVKKCLKLLKCFDLNIEVLPEKIFVERVNSILENENSKYLLKYLMDDFDKQLHLNYNNDIIVKSKFTIKYLQKLKFKWPILSDKYLNKFIELLRGII